MNYSTLSVYYLCFSVFRRKLLKEMWHHKLFKLLSRTLCLDVFGRHNDVMMHVHFMKILIPLFFSFWHSSVVQYVTECDLYTGVAAITHVEHQSSSLTLDTFGEGFHLPSSHSLLRSRLEQDRTLLRNRLGQIICNVCGKYFKFPCDFKRHSVMHTGERDFECDECQKRFKLLSHLKMHIYRFHAGERAYPCDSCGKRYASMSDLKCHVLIHSPERPHVCLVCNKGFITAKDLRKHMQIHSGEKQFECDVCKRKFLRRGHLEKHIMVVHTLKRHHDSNTCSRKLQFLDCQFCKQ